MALDSMSSRFSGVLLALATCFLHSLSASPLGLKPFMNGGQSQLFQDAIYGAMIDYNQDGGLEEQSLRSYIKLPLVQTGQTNPDGAQEVPEEDDFQQLFMEEKNQAMPHVSTYLVKATSKEQPALQKVTGNIMKLRKRAPLSMELSLSTLRDMLQTQALHHEQMASAGRSLDRLRKAGR